MAWHLLPLLAATALQPAPDDAPAPDDGGSDRGSDRGSGGRGSGGRGPSGALDAAYGTPPAQAPDDPNTSDGPGYSDTRRGGTTDTIHRSTARGSNLDGTASEGLQIYDDETYGDDAPQDVPDVHVVQSGDTLWDISGTYLEDPYLWPKLWSWNEHVTNAHWIFPGDRVRLYDPRGDRGGGGGKGGGPDYRFSKTRLPKDAIEDSYVLNQTTFVDAARFETSMKVIGGGEANVLMSTHDTVYMSYDKQHPPIAGERLVAYAPVEKVYDIKDRKVLGYIVQIVGEIDVESLAPKAAEGTVALALHPVERGYRVGPLRRTFKRVDTKPAQKSAAGVIVATINDAGPIGLKSRKRRKSLLGDHVLVGEGQFVVVNIGTSSGVAIGNTLEIVRKGDEWTKKRILKIPYVKCWPRRVIGAAVVMQVQQDTAFAVAVYARREVERGDHVELRGSKPLPEDTEKCDEDKKEKRRSKRKAKADADAEAGDGKAKGTFTVGGE